MTGLDAARRSELRDDYRDYIGQSRPTELQVHQAIMRLCEAAPALLDAADEAEQLRAQRDTAEAEAARFLNERDDALRRICGALDAPYTSPEMFGNTRTATADDVVMFAADERRARLAQHDRADRLQARVDAVERLCDEADQRWTSPLLTTAAVRAALGGQT